MPSFTNGINPRDASVATTSLPIVSLAEWTDESASEEVRAKLAARVRRVCHEIGFFLLQDHGIETEFLREVFSTMRRLFALEPRQKKIIDKRKSRHFRGWESEGSEYTNNRPDVREQVDLWTEHPQRPAHVEPTYLRLLGPNQWFPNEEAVLPGYRELMTQWFSRVAKVADAVTEILAASLGLDRNYFDQHVFGSERMSLTKLIRYPPTPADQAGVNAHHDTGFLTVVCCETSPGLGEWFDVTPPTPDTFIINLGEMLQVMTSNYFIATPHHVINVKAVERFAIGYFHGPSLDARLDPLPLDETFIKAVGKSRRHSVAGFMTSREETQAGVGDMQSSYKPAVYGEQLYNYFCRSYTDTMANHYPDVQLDEDNP